MKENTAVAEHLQKENTGLVLIFEHNSTVLFLVTKILQDNILYFSSFSIVLYFILHLSHFFIILFKAISVVPKVRQQVP